MLCVACNGSNVVHRNLKLVAEPVRLIIRHDTLPKLFSGIE